MTQHLHGCLFDGCTHIVCTHIVCTTICVHSMYTDCTMTVLPTSHPSLLYLRGLAHSLSVRASTRDLACTRIYVYLEKRDCVLSHLYMVSFMCFKFLVLHLKQNLRFWKQKSRMKLATISVHMLRAVDMCLGEVNKFLTYVYEPQVKVLRRYGC